MNKLPYPSLLNNGKASIKGDEAAFKRMPRVARMFNGNQESDDGFDAIFKHITKTMDENDSFHIYSEMINQFIQAFPEMKMGWKNLSDDQKWIFVEGIYYGIRPLTNKKS